MIVIDSKLAGPLAVAIADFRRRHQGLLDARVMADLLVLQQELRTAAVGGSSAAKFDPDAWVAQAESMKPLAVTYEAAGDLLAYSERKIRDLVACRELATVGEGRGARVVVASLEAFVARAACAKGELE